MPKPPVDFMKQEQQKSSIHQIRGIIRYIYRVVSQRSLARSLAMPFHSNARHNATTTPIQRISSAFYGYSSCNPKITRSSSYRRISNRIPLPIPPPPQCRMRLQHRRWALNHNLRRRRRNRYMCRSVYVPAIARSRQLLIAPPLLLLLM